MKDKACEGGRTLTDGDFHECLECGVRVRHDLVYHRLIGFSSACSARQPDMTFGDEIAAHGLTDAARMSSAGSKGDR